jgi:hypothetical protein
MKQEKHFLHFAWSFAGSGNRHEDNYTRDSVYFVLHFGAACPTAQITPKKITPAPLARLSINVYQLLNFSVALIHVVDGHCPVAAIWYWVIGLDLSWLVRLYNIWYYLWSVHGVYNGSIT